MTIKFQMPIIIFAIIVFTSVSAYAQTTAITELSVSVDRDGTSISINVPADFTYLENPESNEIEIILENCIVNFRGHDYIRIPSFSPLFESIEIAGIAETNSSILRIKLTDNIIKPVISVMPSENKIVFGFYSEKQAKHLKVEPVTLFKADFKASDIEDMNDVITVADCPVSDCSVSDCSVSDCPVSDCPEQSDESILVIQVQSDESIPVVQEDDSVLEEQVINYISEFPINAIPDPMVQIPRQRVALEQEQPPEVEISEEPIEKQLVAVAPEVEVLEEPIEKQLVAVAVAVAEEFPAATLEAIHYSQGRINHDVITLEFVDISPRFNYEINSSGCAVLILHNLITPIEILQGDEIRREVRGTIIRSISLKRFDEVNLPALQIMLVGKESLDITIDDLKGIMEITLYAGGE